MDKDLKHKSTDIIICGVGVQGNILAGEILGTAAVNAGLEVWVGEFRGMAQRMASVSSYIRIGGTAYSPIIMAGCCDVIVCFEPLEALRVGVEYLRKGGLIITNTKPVAPVAARMGEMVYPQATEIFAELSVLTKEIFFLDATKLAVEAGNIVFLNVIMLGALSSVYRLPFATKYLRGGISQCVRGHFAEVNLQAFDLGTNAKIKRALI